MPYVPPQRPTPYGAILAAPVLPDPEPEPMPIVNAIPQDVTARSLEALREFCDHYQFPAGAFPYADDWSAETGPGDDRPFFVQGLIYFLLETWMPIMAASPNPGSHDGWEARRTVADAALQSYMRRRLGDVPEPGPHPSPLVGKVTLGEDGFRDEGEV
jgi:hypothetical protein